MNDNTTNTNESNVVYFGGSIESLYYLQYKVGLNPLWDYQARFEYFTSVDARTKRAEYLAKCYDVEIIGEGNAYIKDGHIRPTYMYK